MSMMARRQVRRFARRWRCPRPSPRSTRRIQVAGAAAIAGRERHGDGGAEVLASSAGLSRREAHSQVKLTARAIQDMPRLRDAVESFLLEYRDESVETLYRPKKPFSLPDNLWFIGTMNTADRSIALVDRRLRVDKTDGWLPRLEAGLPGWAHSSTATRPSRMLPSLLGPSHFMLRLKRGLRRCTTSSRSSRTSDGPDDGASEPSCPLSGRLRPMLSAVRLSGDHRSSLEARVSNFPPPGRRGAASYHAEMNQVLRDTARLRVPGRSPPDSESIRATGCVGLRPPGCMTPTRRTPGTRASTGRSFDQLHTAARRPRRASALNGWATGSTSRASIRGIGECVLTTTSARSMWRGCRCCAAQDPAGNLFLHARRGAAGPGRGSSLRDHWRPADGGRSSPAPRPPSPAYSTSSPATPSSLVGLVYDRDGNTHAHLGGGHHSARVRTRQDVGEASPQRQILNEPATAGCFHLRGPIAALLDRSSHIKRGLPGWHPDQRDSINMIPVCWDCLTRRSTTTTGGSCTHQRSAHPGTRPLKATPPTIRPSGRCAPARGSSRVGPEFGFPDPPRWRLTAGDPPAVDSYSSYQPAPQTVRASRGGATRRRRARVALA